MNAFYNHTCQQTGHVCWSDLKANTSHSSGKLLLLHGERVWVVGDQDDTILLSRYRAIWAVGAPVLQSIWGCIAEFSEV